MKIDHIYCINLEYANQRKTAMMEEFQREQLTVDFFDACNGRKYGRDGEFGCAQSHLRIWNDIVEKGYKNALILEDDVKLCHNFKTKLDELCEPEEWDILYLFSIGEILGESCNQDFRYGRCLSTAGYIISNNCANKLHLLEYDDFGCPIDLFISVKLRLKTFVAEDKLIKANIINQLNSNIGLSLSRLLEGWSLIYWIQWIGHAFRFWPVLEILFIILLIFLVKRLY